MQFDRREFLGLVGTASAGSPFCKIVSTTLQQTTAESGTDEAMQRFWASEVRYRPKPATTRGSDATPPPTPSGPPVNYLYFDGDNGFRLATKLDEKGLADKGDIGLRLGIQAFRPSQQDLKNLKQAKLATLRVDLHQAHPLNGLSEPLSWSAIASVPPKPQGYRDFNFDSKSTWRANDVVPLPQGSGYWTWNFFMEKNEGFWGRVMKQLSGANPKSVSAIGFPSIGLQALAALDGVLGFLWSHGGPQWMMQSSDTPVYGTKAARDKITTRAVPLRQEKANDGYYIVAPEKDADKILAAKNLIVNDGLLVPKEAKDSEIVEAANTTIPAVSYLTFKVAMPAIQL